MSKREMDLTTWQIITAIAPTIHKSHLFPVASVEAAAVIMLKGHELGLGLTAAFEFIHIIQGRPSLSSRGALALALQSGELLDMKVEEKHDNGRINACRVWMKRRGGIEYETEFSLADADRAGLIKAGSPWHTYPRYMLKWRAIGAALDVLMPDVIGGLKRAEEFGATINEAGDVIDVSNLSNLSNVIEMIEPERLPSPIDRTGLSLDNLVEEYGADAVMEAAGGRIPATAEEVAEVRLKLAAGTDDAA